MHLGRMQITTSFRERLEKNSVVPDKGDMRSVRPSIRAMEIGIQHKHPAKWIGKFWAQALRDTA